MNRRPSVFGIIIRNDPSDLVLEDTHLLDGFLTQLFTVLEKHPHNSLELNGSEQCVKFLSVWLERESLIPQWQVRPAAQDLSHFGLEDVIDHLLRRVCRDD